MTEYRKPRRFFEDSGVVDARSAYHVELENVVNTKGQDIKTMVDLGRYFSIFAPRQSGKTTFFRDFCARLSQDPTYIPVLLSFQDYRSLQSSRFYAQLQTSLREQLVQRLSASNCPQFDALKSFLKTWNIPDHIAFRELFETLNRMIQQKKIVVFIDEFDGIPRAELENFLTTLRELYQKYKGRDDKALYSVGLVGIRNIAKLIVGGVSPFNIADQVRLPAFSQKNVRDLFSQHTEETNQPFAEGAVEKIHAQTAGQPWLVNRLGTILTVDVKPKTAAPVVEADVDAAVELLMKERNSHFDNLLEKARQHKETFVQIVFDGVDYNPDHEDQSYLEQYGLIREQADKVRPANPIYQQRFLKAFFRQADAVADVAHGAYYTADGFLDMFAVLADFEEYIMRIGVNAFAQGKPYEKTGQFLLTAWLYPFAEGGRGELRHELSSGLGRMDILLTYRGRKYILETKINRSSLSRTTDLAVDQVFNKYLATEQADEGYVVVFDPKRRVGEVSDPEQRISAGRHLAIFVIAIGNTTA